MSSAESPTCPPVAAAASLAASPLPDTFARDAIIAWFRGEFAAANAIIDALCNHLTQVNDNYRGIDYESVFVAIHRRRLNWIPLLHMQKHFSIAGVAIELRRVAAKKKEEKKKRKEGMKGKENGGLEEMKEGSIMVGISSESGDSLGESSSDQKFLDGRELPESQEGQLSSENVQICFEHEDCERRPEMMKATKGFVAKEQVEGHMVNVVKGLKLYEDIFADLEISKLVDFISELRFSGRNGELSGETFMFFNKQSKGNKREIIQMGVPIFGSIKEDMTSNIEPIPSVLQAVIDHLVKWRLIPKSRKPNSCLISFFDEGGYSQPYLKPPHLDQPISTLVLSESTMAFGRILVGDHDGKYKGPLILSLKEGSLLVMRGNSAEMARHVMCPSSNKRVSITFSKVRHTNNQIHPSPIPPLTRAMTHWQPGVPQPCKASTPAGSLGYDAMDVVPKWGVLQAPLVVIAPPRPMVMASRKIQRCGTGVFLPWTVGSRKSVKHLPPRVQRERLHALPSMTKAQVDIDV